MRDNEQDVFDSHHPSVRAIVSAVEKVIVGKTDVIHKCIVALLCGGHVLLEDVPGVGKTMLVKALARSMGCTFKRIQFTPDLLPSDVTGVSIYNQETHQFEFRPGPIAGNIVLADEINRTSPRTQAALLEAMEEGYVTVDGVTHPLPKPFFVIATQNPIEYEGTFPLPEAQLDRFLMKLSLGYPSFDDEMELLRRTGGTSPLLEQLQPVIQMDELRALQQQAAEVHVDEAIRRYVVNIAEATRKRADVTLGVSPRGSVALYRAAQALAFMNGRNYVLPDDVKQLVHSILGHRIVLSTDARLQGVTVTRLLDDILEDIPVPL